MGYINAPIFTQGTCLCKIKSETLRANVKWPRWNLFRMNVKNLSTKCSCGNDARFPRVRDMIRDYARNAFINGSMGIFQDVRHLSLLLSRFFQRAKCAILSRINPSLFCIYNIYFIHAGDMIAMNVIYSMYLIRVLWIYLWFLRMRKESSAVRFCVRVHLRRIITRRLMGYKWSG